VHWNPANRNSTRIPSLDGLRAISIVLVVAGHWAELRYHSEVAGAFANLGVRIFFVISGYLITTLLVKECANTSTIDLRDFYVRRAYRILPAAVTFMLVVFVVFWHELRWYHMAAAVFYLANFDWTHPWFLGHLWSLSVEEQFYFLWPVALKKWFRYRQAMLVGVIAFSPLYRVACHFFQLHGKADETFPAVADVLAVGCLLAIFAKRLPFRLAAAHRGFAWALLVPVALVPVYVGLLRFHTTPLLLFSFVAADACLDCGASVACGAKALLDFECASGGLAGEDQLQLVFVAATVCVRNAQQAVVLRFLRGGAG
jgi:peptidoglycan/LPS O-acetylase OafA/YrhL